MVTCSTLKITMQQMHLGMRVLRVSQYLLDDTVFHCCTNVAYLLPVHLHWMQGQSFCGLNVGIRPHRLSSFRHSAFAVLNVQDRLLLLQKLHFHSRILAVMASGNALMVLAEEDLVSCLLLCEHTSAGVSSPGTQNFMCELPKQATSEHL